MAVQTAGMARIARWVAGVGATGLNDRELLKRFAVRRDQLAFEALVGRHTRMVLGVCRRELTCTQDAEDACQAVFLLLAEKAGRGNWQPSIAGWLYTTARNVARNAKVATDRRSRRESRAALLKPTSTVDDLSGRELLRLLDEELDRLAPHHREPLILCYLEGLPQDEAASRLGLSSSTLKTQLKHARQQLAAALTARGCELGAVLLVVAAYSARASGANLRNAILAAVTGAPSQAVKTMTRNLLVHTLASYARIVLFATASAGAAIGLVLAANRSGSSSLETEQPRPALAEKETAVLSRIGTGRFRAEERISDARYSANGKKIVGCAGTKLYVWEAATGERLPVLDTKLELLDDPAKQSRKELAFAVHPKKSLVACGGIKDGKTYLQIWNFDTGERIAEAASTCNALKLLAWTPEGEALIERANIGWVNPGIQRLLVYNEKLEEIGTFDLPAKLNPWSGVMTPLPGEKQILLWHGESDPFIYDIEFGNMRGTIPNKMSIPSGLALSPNAKVLAATSTNDIRLLQFPSGDVHKVLPVLRDHWEKPRPLFSPDSKTVYVWDYRPIAYDVETGEEKWKTSSRTVHSVRTELCDISADGRSLLVRQGQGLALYDAKTGAERNPAESPSVPTGMFWSPDGLKLFTRATNHDRTWTAWDVASGKRLNDMQPTGFVDNDNWKLNPDLFFIRDGREIVVVLENAESTEGTGPKELLVFDTASGKCLRRLGKPLPKEIFQWMYPIEVDPSGKYVLMQAYAISSSSPGVPGTPTQVDLTQDFSYRNVLWDTDAQKIVKDWLVYGNRTDGPRHYGRYYVTTRETLPEPFPRQAKKAGPAKIRCYALAAGKLVHELQSDFLEADTDRIADDLLLSLGNDGTCIVNETGSRWEPKAPFRYDLWDISTESKLQLFDLPEKTQVVLGPHGQYVVQVIDDHSFEVYEPFVLKKAVAKINTPSRAKQFEFSADGKRLSVSMADTNILILDATSWRKQIDEHIAREIPTDLSPLYEDLGKGPEAGLRAARLLAAAGDRMVPDLEQKAKAGKPEVTWCSRAVRALRWLDTAVARMVLTRWTKGDPNAPLTKAAAEALAR